MTRGLWILLCAATVWAQNSQERGKRVVMEAVAALGGDRYLAMQDRVETGRAYSFYREEVSGLSQATIYTQYLPPGDGGPDSLWLRERQSFGKMEGDKWKEISAVLFTKGQGYEITFRGARPLPDDTLARYKTTTFHNVFYILRERLKEPGMIFDGKGLDVWMNQPVEIVDLVDANNDVVTVYFHQSTKFPIRQVYYRRDPKTREKIEEVTEYGKFRDVGDGIYWPLTVLRTRDGDRIFQMFSDTVQVNQKLSDSLFVLPTGMKILKKL
jgi:hypothetical protein